jgi:NADH:ubiquinone oxidoreductase subunit F (NADH-binding)
MSAPAVTGPALIDVVARAGLRGRGGAGFPLARKLAAVAEQVNAQRTRAVVLVNGCESEPVSQKDRVLLHLAPHLVLDGAVLAALAVGADEIVVCVHRGATAAGRLPAAIAQRRPDAVNARVVEVPNRYVASEESALVNFLTNAMARPTAKPPRPFEEGVDARPTLIANVETLAHLALIARYGDRWFASAGTADSPGTQLVTIGGTVSRPGVYEIALGTRLAEVLRTAGPPRGAVQAVLAGGFGGGWLPLPRAGALPVTHADLASAGASLGVGSFVVLPANACGVAETARIAHYLAGESARQCGPCMFGLPAVAADLWTLARGDRAQVEVLDRIHRRLRVLPGRGACGHPDGFARLLRSALTVFAGDFSAHAHGHACRWTRHPVLPVPRPGYPGPEGWQ